MPLEIEPASAEPGVPVGEWLLDTAPEILGYLFGGREAAIRNLTAHWAMPNGLFSHALAVVARREGATVGLMHGMTQAEKNEQRPHTIERLAADLAPDALAAQAARGATMAPLIQPVPDDAWYVQHLVVDETARGGGAGKALLHHAFDKAKAAGYTAVHLDVEISNPAQAFYLSQGMEAAVEVRVPRLAGEHGVSGAVRMVRTL